MLAVSMGSGAIAGGSGVQYFVGDFDGATFTADNLVTDTDPPTGEVFEDFESGYDGWTVKNDTSGGPFGAEPAPGTLPGQNPVSGYRDTSLVNGFIGGDAPRGSMTSRRFTISQDYINLLVGGGNHPWGSAAPTAVNLLVDGKVARTATGGDSGGWGHINVDHIMFSGQPALSAKQRYSWADYGKDFYAAVTWNNAPGRTPVWLGWMNNWEYASGLPTSPWRGAQSLPRQLTLKRIDGELRLIQQPVRTLRTLRRDPATVIRNRTVTNATTALPVTGSTLEITAEFAPGTADRFGLIVRADDTGKGTKIGYNRSTGRLYVDRTGSGDTTAGPTFPGVHAGPMKIENGRVRITLYLDASSVEVFGGSGETVITDQIFPAPDSDQLRLFADRGTAKLISLKAWPLNSARP